MTRLAHRSTCANSALLPVLLAGLTAAPLLGLARPAPGHAAA
jgi:hypothetical protein